MYCPPTMPWTPDAAVNSHRQAMIRAGSARSSARTNRIASA